MTYAPHDITALAVRASVGVFFASSGYHKLFVPEVRAKFTGLMQKLNAAAPVNLVLVPAGEFLGGLGLITGVLAPIAAAGLFFITGMAILMDVWKDIAAKRPRDAVDWVAKCFYVPEPLLMLLLGVIILDGPGALSLDTLVHLPV